jgi:hypothetical protein
MPEIALQPKQSGIYDLIVDSDAVVIGVGGGRGAAKSSGADRVAITLMYERKGYTVCMVMRTWVKQMVPFHLEAIRRDFPWLRDSLTSSPPAQLRIASSRMEFKYAENYDSVVEAFRSGNYDLIIIDQAEQFSWREITEIRKAARSKSAKPAKVVLLFNMRGTYIQDLRKIFHLGEVDEPKDFAFLKMNPWDNVEWVRSALAEDGYSDADYYRWTEEQRKAYAAERGPYTRQLATDDPVIAKADWDGDWDSIEGAYFANSFDLEATRAGATLVARLKKPWSQYWYAQDWGRAHFCVTYWAYRIAISPAEAKDFLGWDLVKPINVTVIYRELVLSDMEPAELAQEMVNVTPEPERSKLKAYYLSPECVTDEPRSIGSQQGVVLRAKGMPGPVKADNDRIGGWGLMASLFKATRGEGWGQDKDGKRFQYDDAILISAECPQLLDSIPIGMRDDKNINDMLKTDKGQARLEMDCLDSCRYLVKSMLAPKRKTEVDKFNEKMEVAKPVDRLMLAYRHDQEKKRKFERPVIRPSWRQKL